MSENLDVKRFYYYFEQISKIPRNSGHEEKIADYLCEFAKEKQLEFYRDKLNNVLIKKQKTCKSDSVVLLQGHTDMVCEKTSDSTHDFLHDPIELIYCDGKIKANNTTLGADDGFAVALMLALLESNISHPTLECLFTSDEETGLCGATSFDYTKIKAKYMINLDSEDINEAVVGCAGGVRCYFDKKCNMVDIDNNFFYKISVSNLCGGHSGTDIDKNRKNANLIITKLISLINKKQMFRLASMQGGNKDNAIPFEASCVIAFPCDAENLILDIISEFRKSLELCKEDKDIKITFEKSKVNKLFSYEDTKSIIEFILSLDNGVISYSDGFPITSANNGITLIENGNAHISVSFRSSSEVEKEILVRKNEECAKKYGFEYRRGSAYPGWEYKKVSKIREIYKESYRFACDGREPNINVIHAGLECGIISDKLPQLDIISIGPTMNFVHTVKEELIMESIDTAILIICNMLCII